VNIIIGRSATGNLTQVIYGSGICVMISDIGQHYCPPVWSM